MSDDSDYQFTDDDVDDTNHSRIVENVLSLNKAQNLKRPSRTEPTLQISEFNLVKSVTGQLQIDDLTKVLKTRKKHAKVGEKVERTKKKTHTLPKPLEKPQAERIRRSVGYEKNRFLFDRWEAFVTSNRASAHQVFPLDSVENLKVETKKAADIASTWTYKSDLQKELESLENKVEVYNIDENDKDDEFPLTLEELKEKRQEAAKLRAHQSYKEAKARRQNKIKSKKYHRILRKERIKQQLKEFEELQKTNPEAALKKLEEIEKARALERFSLRHKGTGQWAKSKQVRAKYDKESRQVLAQQLAISRELTQKQKHMESESEEEELKIEESSSNNPWIIKPDKEVSEFTSSYKQFWNEQNKNKEAIIQNDDDEQDNKIEEIVINDKQEKVKQIKKKVKKNKVVPKNQQKLNNSSGDWDIDDIFDQAEKKVAEKLKNKLAKSNKVTNKLKPKNKKATTKNNKKIDLSMPSQSKKQIIDEKMNETTHKTTNNNTNNNIDALKNIINLDNSNTQSNNIDPEKFMKPKVTNLDSALPSLIIENENNNNQKHVIMEAFEDNDIVEDFAKDKQEEVDQDKPQDIDLNLPGWGSWAGTGIDPKKQRKRKRFIIKMPETMPRRDDNKGSLIINEKAAAKIKPHLVSEVPFPFKTVKDYEASIRTPIGNSFVPELAYRRFIRPAVETKMGAVIEPATTSILMGKPKK
ncbi:unnamed protein product [Ceutorhynchus assimilis]|uniref:U3 small nucleolar RNA-associated protein 14 homolog A n=1 Tax=Ceutorhynchus assimilis TaxID=467358 RepID=A0A9P0GK30_9CUCU|nr:unnamed protein product [Ceutorhynchus assimilis]